MSADTDDISETSERLERRAVVSALLADRGDALLVTGLGSATYDAHAVGDHDGNYYLWGAMGGAAMVGLGLALARPERRVMVITGDGEQLMQLGAFATVAVAGVSNLEVYVIDNEHYGETGFQESHTAAGLDLAAVAAGCGIGDTRTVIDADDLERLLAERRAGGATGASVAVIKVRAEPLPRSMPSRDAVHVKNRFRAHLGLEPN